LNIYGVRVANQMGWSKVIKEADQDGGVVITSNGRAVAMIVPLYGADIDFDKLRSVSFPIKKHMYFYFIVLSVMKLLKEMILDVQLDVELKEADEGTLDWYKLLINKRWNEIVEEYRITYYNMNIKDIK